jgi:hypothetical protein
VDQGEAATELLKAVIRGTGYPANVPDTPEYRDLYARLEREVAELPPGVAPEIPWDYNHPPDPDPIGPQPLTIGQQVTGVDLSWRDAWRTELRGPHGEWVKGTGEAQAISVIRHAHGGFTVSPRTGAVPDRGFMVSRAGHVHTYPASVLDHPNRLAAAVHRTLRAEGTSFQGKNMYLGGWVHGGKLYLEPSQEIDDQAAAAAEGRARKQIAIWDVAGHREIPVGGTGESLSGEGYPGQFSDRLLNEWRRAQAPDVKQHLNLAGAHYDAGEYKQAVGEIRKASAAAAVAGDKDTRDRLFTLADTIASGVSSEAKDEQAASRVVSKAAPVVAKMFGSDEHLDWDGKPPTIIEPRYTATGTLLAEIDWNGHVRITDPVAHGLAKDEADKTAPVEAPSNYTVALHEMIHAVVPEGQRRDANGDRQAYQDPSMGYADIEEGFTELGTIQHAAEFFTKIGVGDRKTKILSMPGDQLDPAWLRKAGKFSKQIQAKADELLKDGRAPQLMAAKHLADLADGIKASPEGVGYMAFHDQFGGALSEAQHLGDPAVAHWAMDMKAWGAVLQDDPNMYKHDTMAEYAQRIATPERIKTGRAWGHYPNETSQAYEWASMTAQMRLGLPEDDPRVQREIKDLADLVNREGTAGKPMAMARAVIGDMLPPNLTQANNMLVSAARTISDGWENSIVSPAGLRKEAYQKLQQLQGERGPA